MNRAPWHVLSLLVLVLCGLAAGEIVGRWLTDAPPPTVQR